MEKLLAIDTYEIYGSAYFTSVDQSVLSMLYQPIIGKEAYSLFMTLWAQWSLTKHEKILLQHHHLLLTSQASLQSFQAARKRLEGIGLLQSLVKKKRMMVITTFIVCSVHLFQLIFSKIAF